MNCIECGKPVRGHKERCTPCRKMIQRERAERIAELPWYIFDQDDPTVAGSNAHPLRPVEDVFRINMSKKKFTV